MRPPAGSILLPLHQAGPVRSPPGLNHSPVHFLLLRSGFWMLPAGLPDCPPAPDKRKPVLPEPPGLPLNILPKLLLPHTVPVMLQADFWHSLTEPLLRKAGPPAAQSGQVPDCSFPFWHLSPCLVAAICSLPDWICAFPLSSSCWLWVSCVFASAICFSPALN